MERFSDCIYDADRSRAGLCAAGLAECWEGCPHYFKKQKPRKYKNVRAYLEANTEADTNRFCVTATKRDDKEPGLIHFMIHPEARDGETTDFLLRPGGTEEYTQEL